MGKVSTLSLVCSVLNILSCFIYRTINISICKIFGLHEILTSAVFFQHFGLHQFKLYSVYWQQLPTTMRKLHNLEYIHSIEYIYKSILICMYIRKLNIQKTCRVARNRYGAFYMQSDNSTTEPRLSLSKFDF